MGRIGILSGTFDPVHIGHLAMARACLETMKLERVLLAPVQKALTPPENRLAMLRLACRGERGIEPSPFAMPDGREGAIGLVRAVARAHPGQEIVYILGADRLPGIPAWRETQALFKACAFAVCPRPGYNAQGLSEGLRRQGARVTLLAYEGPDISSARVRAKLRLLSDAPGLMERELVAYIAARGLYLPDYARQLRQALSASRFAHSLGVRAEGARLALRHGAPIQKAGVAGILHDCAKCMELSRLQTIAKKGRLMLPPETMASNALLHGPVGALVSRLRYHVHDEDILNAIRCHTTGRADMSPLEMVIFVADAIEPNRRDYPGLKETRALAEEDLEKAAFVALSSTRDAIKKRGGVYSPLSAQAIEELKIRLARPKEHKEDMA